MIIAGIGSRKVPQDVLSAMRSIGAWCANNNITIYSGHADGCDWAFEQGAQDSCVAFIPWSTFNSNLVSRAELIVPHFTQDAIEISQKFHPAWDKLSYGVKKLIARDAFQILGQDLAHPVNAVVCYTEGAKVAGGTGQALRIATDYKIPIINMGSDKYRTYDSVIAALKELKHD